MRILLVQPPFSRLRGHHHPAEFQPFLGLGYLTEVLSIKGHDVYYYNADDGPRRGLSTIPSITSLMDNYSRYFSAIRGDNHPVWNEFEKLLLTFRPDAVGFSVKSPLVPVAIKMSGLVKEFSPDVKVIWGNTHASVMADQVLSNDSVDFVVRNEGEETMVQLLDWLENKKETVDIAGLSGKVDGKITHYPHRPFINDIDNIPFPTRHLIKSSRGKMPVITSRGCQNKCRFCADSGIWKGYVRFRSVGNVVVELQEIIKRYGVREISFSDPTFNQNKERVKELCDAFIKNRLDFIWDCLVRLDNIDEEMLKLMYRAGCSQIGFGIETGSDRLLKEANKGFTLKQVRNAVSMIQRTPLISTAFFIVGLPSETHNDLKRSEDFLKELEIDRVFVSNFTLFPGSEYFDKLSREKDLSKGYPWERFSFYSPLFIQNPDKKPESYFKAIMNFISLVDKINARNKSHLLLLKRKFSFYLRHPKQLYFSFRRFIGR